MAGGGGSSESSEPPLDPPLLTISQVFSREQIKLQMKPQDIYSLVALEKVTKQKLIYSPLLPLKSGVNYTPNQK